MVFMIRYSSELPLNPFLKSIFGLPDAAYARSRPRRRLSVATKLLKNKKKAESERRTAFQSGAASSEARHVLAGAARGPGANWRRFQREPLGLEPRQRHKDGTAEHNARDKLMRIKGKSVGKDGKMTSGGKKKKMNLSIRIPVNVHFRL